MPVFTHYGVGLCVPEISGPIDPGSEAHDLIMSVFGGMSKGERNRVKIRVRSAMASQAKIEGRYLGGRPPYGYQLGDAGPHPNPAKAADGKRLHRLEPDPIAAPVVRRIYREYLAGNGLHAIAKGLTPRRHPVPLCPRPRAQLPPRRRRLAQGCDHSDPHQPRYTGRQVWNKQRKAEILLDIEDVAAGYETKFKWNEPGTWIWSDNIAHEPLVSAENYCTLCGWKMEPTFNHGRPHYRCRYPAEYAEANGITHPRAIYVREDHIVPHLDKWLCRSSHCTASTLLSRHWPTLPPATTITRSWLMPRAKNWPPPTANSANTGPCWRPEPTLSPSPDGSGKSRWRKSL